MHNSTPYFIGIQPHDDQDQTYCLTPCSSPLSAGPTCALAGPCRSAVTVADEADGTSSVGDFESAGLAFLASAVGSIAPGVDGCWP